MKKCGLYVRVSTDNQARCPEGSLKNQTQRLREELKHHSQPDDPWEEVKLYVEEGYSGKNVNRPKFKELILDIKKGVIDTILCTELSRISRSVRDFLEILEYFKNYKAELIIIKQNIDTTTPFGKAMFTILVTLAEFEREMTSQRTSESMLARARRGLWNGGQLLGYDIDPQNKGYLVINKDEAKIAKHIFELYVKTNSCPETAKILNSGGYRTKGYASVRGKQHLSKRFTKQSIHHLLTNIAYIGKKAINKGNKNRDQKKLPFNKQYAVVNACWKGIIKQDFFERVQKTLRRKFRRSERQSRNYPFLLSGIIKCGACGTPLQGATTIKGSGKQYYYYRHERKHRRKYCKVKPIPAGRLESIIKNRINTLLGDNHTLLDDAIKEANKKLKKLTPALSNLIRQKQKECTSLRLQTDTIINKLLHNKSLSTKRLTELLEPKLEALDKQQKGARSEIAQLKDKLESLKADHINPQDFKGKLSSISNLLKELDPHQQRELMAAFIEDIRLYDSKIEVFFFQVSKLKLSNNRAILGHKLDLGPQWGASLISLNPIREITIALNVANVQGYFYVALCQRVRENICTVSLRGVPKARRSNPFLKKFPENSP